MTIETCKLRLKTCRLRAAASVTDFAEETSNLSALASAATGWHACCRKANQRPQAALQLLQ